MKFNRNRKNSAGFSLIELLVVVAIMLVIAAIAVPSLLAAKRNANDAAAIQGLRQIDNAEAAFSNAYQSGYSPTLADLGGGTTGTAASCAPGTVATSTAACLIDPVWATGGTKSGYTFTLLNIVGTPTTAPGFVASAVPNVAGSTGNSAYCTMNDNVVRISPGGATLAATVAACGALNPLNSSVTN
jgi:type IV pilus assembly protein PilA